MDWNDVFSLDELKKFFQDKKEIGLALGGGGVLGAAHIGVLKAFEEKEIEISYISGTSIGAMVASLHAFGKSWQEIQEIAIDMEWMDISQVSLSRFGLLSNEKIKEILNEHVGDKFIEESSIPLAMVATNISNGEKVVISKGAVADGVMASTCIPGVFIPVEQDGELLVDGGIVENIPVQTARKLGAEFVVGVDLNAKHAYGRPKNLVQLLLNTFHFSLKATAALQTEDADLLIQPDLSNFSRTRTDQVKKLIEKGYQDTINVLDEVL